MDNIVLASRQEAQDIAKLARWWIHEWEFMMILADAHFKLGDIHMCMTTGVN